MKTIDRRTFLLSGSIALGCTRCTKRFDTNGDEKTQTVSGFQNPMAIATYSFWRFKDGLKLPIETCIDLAAEMGFEGLDILHIQMHKEDDQYLRELKRHALINGVAGIRDKHPQAIAIAVAAQVLQLRETLV